MPHSVVEELLGIFAQSYHLQEAWRPPSVTPILSVTKWSTYLIIIYQDSLLRLAEYEANTRVNRTVSVFMFAF